MPYTLNDFTSEVNDILGYGLVAKSFGPGEVTDAINWAQDQVCVMLGLTYEEDSATVVPMTGGNYVTLPDGVTKVVRIYVVS